MTPRLRNLLIGLFGVLLLAAAYAASMRAAAATRLATALDDEQRCQKLVADIEALRSRPRWASLTAESPQTITARAEAAMKFAALPPTALIRIEPQSPVRLGESSYRLRATRLELRRVTLEQLTKFAAEMIDRQQGTTLRDLRLSASDAEGVSAGGPETWTAELVLTQLIFSPTRR